MLPNVNQIIYISIDDGENYILKTRVADIGQYTFGIELPIDIETGRIKIIPPSSNIKGWYISNDQGQFNFETQVIELKKGQVPLLILKQPNNYERVQRRDYLRVSASLETSYKLIEGNDKEWHIVRTIDVSGGGIQFILPYYKLNLDQQMKGWLALQFQNSTIEHISYTGKVLRVSQPNENSRIYLISIKFTNIQENMREKIIRYCYEKQVEIGKKVERFIN